MAMRRDRDDARILEILKNSRREPRGNLLLLSAHLKTVMVSDLNDASKLMWSRRTSRFS